MNRVPHLVAALIVCGTLATSHAAGTGGNAPASAAVVQRRMAAQRLAYRQSASELAIGSVRIAQSTVPVFGRAEAQFSLTATYASPYDPQQIQVDGVITRPDGRAVTVPAFYCAPYEPERGLAQMGQNVPYGAAGTPGWRLRFAPDTPGEFRLVIRARDAAGRVAESGVQSFRAEPSTRKGFVRVATGNPMFFENSADGSLFWPVGANVAYTRSDEQRKGATAVPSYDHYFGRAHGKMNATRVWLCHWSWLEWTPQQTTNIWAEYAGVGHYNQMVAAALDQVFALAERHGLRIMLVTEDNNEFSKTESPTGSWAAHPYNKLNGGPCAEPSEFLTSSEARRLYRNRLRYIAARWGYSDSLWALNSWNDYSNPGPGQIAWLKEMHAYVHGLFAGYRPIVYGTNFRFAADQISDYRQAGHGGLSTQKPNVVQECYYTREPESFRAELHEQLWQGLGRGLGGIMVWDHVLVDRTDAWDEFRPLMRFVADLPLHAHPWQPVEARVVTATAHNAGPFQRAVVLRSYGDVPDYGARPPQNRFAVNLAPSRQWLEGYSRTLFGPNSKGKDWRNPPTFVVDLPTDGKLLVELSEFSGRTTTFTVSQRDGDKAPWRVATSVQLENGRRLVTPAEKWVQVPLPRATRQIMFDARGDWVRTERVALILPIANASGLVDVTGWTDGRHAFLHLQNQSHSRLLAEVLGQQLVPLRDVQLQVAGLRDGAYRIISYDTHTAAAGAGSTSVVSSGRLNIHLPGLNEDAALKIVPAD